MTRFKNGLGKDTGTGTWIYCFKVHGRVYKGSTRAKDRVTAERILGEVRREAVLDQKGLLGRIPTIQELVRIWQTAHQGIHSHHHLQSVEATVRLWILPTLGDLRIDRVTTSMMESVRQKMLDAERSPVSANLMVRSARLLWRYAKRLGYIEQVPFTIQQQKVQRKPRPVIPSDQVRIFFQTIDAYSHNPQVGVMVRVMVGLGLRQTEALEMRWEWFCPDQKTYTVGKAKGKEARILPIPSWLWTVIHSMPNAVLSPWVFPAQDGKPHRNNFLHKPLAHASTKLGLGNLTQHRLRATFATLHAQSNTPITEIQGMLGHKCITTTMIYIETSLNAKRRAQDALSEKLGFACVPDH